MKTIRCFSLVLMLMAFATPAPPAQAQNTPSVEAFWEKFRTAVISKDKHQVADLSRYPIRMPYGMRPVRTRAQLVKRFREVFNHESDAALCFAEAKPVVEAARPNEFSVGCRNAAGDEVVIYYFVLSRAGWRFNALDNLNE